MSVEQCAKGGRCGRCHPSVKIMTLLVAAFFAGSVGSTHAADRFWIGTTGGDWYDQQKWAVSLQSDPPATVPGVGDHARFEQGGSTYGITFVDDVDVNRISIPNDIVTFDLASQKLTTSSVIHVGTVANDIGSLTLRNGTVSTTEFFLGELPGTFAEFDVNNSTLTVTNDVAVGGNTTESQGSGLLTVQSGGDVAAGGLVRVWETGAISIFDGSVMGTDALISGGAVTLTGADSTLQIDAEAQFAEGVPGVHVGLAPSVSRMTIEFGGTVEAPGLDFNVGFDQSSLAQVDVRSSGSSVTTGTARIGSLGDGTLAVEFGAHAQVQGDLTTAAGPNSRGTILVDGASTQMRVDGTTTIARQGISLLQISDGGFFHSRGDTNIASEVGPGGPSLGHVTVGGAAAAWHSDGDIFVGGNESGAQGEGQIIVRDDGALNNDGALHIWPTGTLTMEGGVLHTTDLLLKDGAGLELTGGSIIVEGGQFRSPVDAIGFSGTDLADPVTLSLLDGAQAEIPLSWYIGSGPATSGATTVSGVSPDGRRSTLRNAGSGNSENVVVAVKGTGTMQVLDGGLVDVGDDMFVAFQGDAIGLLEVRGVSDGFRSTVLATRGGDHASITVGGREGATGGRGDLDVLGGGLVETSGDMFIARNTQSRGDVTLNGRNGLLAEIRVGDDLFLGGNETEAGGQGEILLGGGGLLEVGDLLKVWPGGFVDMDEGTLRANRIDLIDASPGFFNFFLGRVEANEIIGDFANFDGTLAHGEIVGGMTIDGNYTQFGNATLEIDMIDLNVAAVQDIIHVAGTATLAGTLRVIMDPELRPAVGERFTIMTFDTRVGEFDSLVVTGLALFDTVYNDQSVELVVTDSPLGPGDLDRNGVVNLGDYALLHDCMTGPIVGETLTFPCTGADIDGNDRIDLRDVSLWELHRSFQGLPGVARWTAPTGGQWKDDPNWRTANIPSPGDQVFIDVPGEVATVTYDRFGEPDGPLASLYSNEKLRLDFAALSVAGAFQMNNALELACGTVVDSSVNLRPGSALNVVLSPCISTVDGVTVHGSVDILGTNNALRVINGLTLNGNARIAGFTGSTGNGLAFSGPNKFLDGNATISFISNPSSSFITQSDGGSLHIKPGVTIRGAEGAIGRADAPLILDGVVRSDAAGMIQLRGLNWVNNGSLSATGEQRELWVRHSWTNHGTIEATNNARLILGDPGSGFQNLGTISATNADVRLNGDFTIADLGTFDFEASTVVIEGTFINDTGLVLDAGSFNWDLGRGTVLGGTISSADGTTFDPVPGICCGDTVLDGVTLDANMVINRERGVIVRNGLTLNGTILLNAFQSLGASVRMDGPNGTIDGTGRIQLLTTGGNGVFQHNGGMLEIGPDITIFGAGGQIGTFGGQPTPTLINHGTIHSDRPGFVTIRGTDWINNGSVLSSGGGNVTTRDPWTNNGTVRVEGASFFDLGGELNNQDTLHVSGGTLTARNAWTNNGTLRLGSGPFLDSKSDFTQSATGTFLSEIRSTSVNGFGKMIVSGTATLDGTLRIELGDTYTPSAGHSFVVLQYGNRVGEFASIEVPGLDPSLEAVPVYHDTFLEINIQQR